MSSEAVPSLRTIAFGGLRAPTWGVVWSADPVERAVLGLAQAEGATETAVVLEGAGPDEDWQLRGEAAKLVCAPLRDAVAAAAYDQPLTGFDQLCRLQGSFVLGDSEQRVDCLGVRGAHTGTPEISEFESVRVVSGWFEPARGFSLLALRPLGARGHDRDVVSAAVLAPEGASAVATPLLSTTYADDGRPVRVGLELWVEEPSSDEEPDAPQQYPRRAAGEPIGPAVRGSTGDLELLAEPLSWRSADGEGAGVYLLARRQ